MTANRSRGALRRHYRVLRRSLTGAQQQQHADAVSRQFLRSPWALRAHVIGGYAATDGELELAPLFNRLHRMSKVLALPVIESGEGRMSFFRYRPGDALLTNRHGIAEPGQHSRHVARLDLLLVPLVAFDGHGTRLGMGGGFYDRFAARHGCTMVGIAHEIQRADALPREDWDHPLAGVVTETSWQMF